VNRGCCGVRTFPDEAKALRVLGKITALRETEGGTATYSAATGVYRCRSGRWHLSEPAEETGFSDAVKATIHLRAGFRCEACGTWLGEKGGQCQHIVARGEGGSRDPLINSVVNGALLCGTPMTGCHGLCEDRDERMHAEGFWLDHGQDPAAEPFLVHLPGDAGGMRKWRTDDGGYSDFAPGRRAA
jgi:hypothetical protein